MDISNIMSALNITSDSFFFFGGLFPRKCGLDSGSCSIIQGGGCACTSKRQGSARRRLGGSWEAVDAAASSFSRWSCQKAELIQEKREREKRETSGKQAAGVFEVEGAGAGRGRGRGTGWEGLRKREVK